MNQMNFPASEPNDSDDVALALETAEALWNKGDPSEAVRWLRRAAEAAGDSGDDLRAVVLAKAVAELNTSGAENVPKQIKPPPLPPQASHGKLNGDAMDADYPLGLKGGLKGISKAPPSPPSTRKGLPKPSTPPSTRPQTAARTLHPPPTPPGKSAKANPVDEAPASGREPMDAQHEPVSVRSGASRSLAPASSRLATKPSKAHRMHESAPAHEAHPRPAKTGAPRVFARAAVKVYVTANAQAGDKLEVYVLREGQAAPPGAVEAMLVPIQRGTKLFE
jgi:hypothetical protein